MELGIISDNPNITMEFIEKYPNKPWSWLQYLNSNITMEIIEKYPNKPWSWNDISENPNITMEFIEKYPNKPWDWAYISENPNITMEIIEKYPDKPWDCIGYLVIQILLWKLLKSILINLWTGFLYLVIKYYYGNNRKVS